MPPQLSGALPAKQARSREMRDRLLCAGRELLQREGFEQVSIADIARAAGCSVGAFYFRFRDKEAFFTCVVDAVTKNVLEELESFSADRSAELSPSETVARCVSHFVTFFRTHEGLIRAVHRKTVQDPEHWKPLRMTARRMETVYESAIAEKYGEQKNPTFRKQTRIGFQLAAGVLVNAVLNRPPLLGLDSEELPFWLTETVLHCLHVQVPPTLGKAAMQEQTGRAAGAVSAPAEADG